MSRKITISDTVIRNPKLLKDAIEFMNDSKNYGVVEAQYKEDAEGNILEGHFHLVAKKSREYESHVFLSYSGRGKAVYENGTLKGHFRLMVDEDFQRAKNLATVIADHYNVQVLRQEAEARGEQTEMWVEKDGAVCIACEDSESAAAVAAY